MDVLVVGTHVLLAAVFLVSGVAKLADRAGTREAVEAFGLPGAMRAPVAAVLPPVELAVAALLLSPAARAGSLLALGLLVAFSTTVAVNLAAGRHPACRCFGRLGSSDVSWRTLGRNAALGAAALAGLAGSPARTLADLAAQRSVSAALLVALGAAVVGLAVLLGEAALSRSAQRHAQEAEEAAFESADHADAPAPDFTLTAVQGEQTTLAALLAPGLPLLLVFTSPGCGPCRRLEPVLAQWSRSYADRLRVVVACAGTRESVIATFGTEGAFPLLLDEDKAVRHAFGVRGTPGGVLVDTAGRVVSPVAIGETLVRRLLAAALAGEPADLSPAPRQGGVAVSSLTLASTVGRRPTVRAHDDGDQTVLFDEGTAASVAVDPLGALVWQLLDGVSPLADVVADLAVEFDADAELVGADVLALVGHLGREGLLDGVAAEWPEDADTDQPATDGVPALSGSAAG